MRRRIGDAARPQLNLEQRLCPARSNIRSSHRDGQPGTAGPGQTTGNSRDFFQSLIPSVSGRQRLTNLTPHGIMLIVRGSKLQPAFRSLARPAVKQYPRKTQQHRSSISAAQSAGCGLYLQPAKKEVRAILAARRDYYMSVQRDNLAKQSRTFSDNYRGWGCPPISLNAPHRIARASARSPLQVLYFQSTAK